MTELNFDSEFRPLNKKTYIKFDKEYPYAPMVYVTMKKITKSKIEFPLFAVSPIGIDRKGFWLIHTEFDKNEFMIFYEVLLDQEPLSDGIYHAKI
jgi:hypothetical protein